MTNIVCDRYVLAIIKEQSHSGLPNEVCGLLFGHANHITHVVPIQNIAPTPTTAFLMDGHHVTVVLRQHYNQRREWVGVYHSHPQGGPSLSHSDREQAHPGIWQMLYNVPTETVHLFEVQAGRITELSISIVP